MDGNEQRRPPNPRRRKRTKMQNFKEAYLPAILLALVVLLIAIFLISAIRGALIKRAESNADKAAQQIEAQKRLEQEAGQLLQEAQRLANNYDYDAALAKLNTFSGDIYQYNNLLSARDQYTKAKDSLVLWNDLSKIPHLSVNQLIAEAERTFTCTVSYASQLRNEYITTGEFSAILQQLYDKGYVLVGLDDIVSENAAGYTTVGVSLPEGKRPIMLTQTHVNYYKYLSDGDYNGVPDADGAGFATRLILDDDGNFTCEMLDASGETVTGAFDVVPILEGFIAEHPDFSYRGARAALAVTGYEGLFGYATTPDDKESLSEEDYAQQVQQVTALVAALRERGYTIASYTYDHAAYGDISDWAVQQDLQHWEDEVTPILGDVDILLLAKGSDIAAPSKEYSGVKLQAMQDAGFRCFIGYCNGSEPWALVTANYIRQGRLVISGQALEETPRLYQDFFSAASVLDPKR